ncbi:hypothetical protein ISCGN_001401 [Ixodes scapularis]
MRSSASAFATTVSATATVRSTPATILSAGRVTHCCPNFRRHGPRLKQNTASATITAGELHLLSFTTQDKRRKLPASLPRRQRCTPPRAVYRKAPTASELTAWHSIKQITACNPAQLNACNPTRPHHATRRVPLNQQTTVCNPAQHNACNPTRRYHVTHRVPLSALSSLQTPQHEYVPAASSPQVQSPQAPHRRPPTAKSHRLLLYASTTRPTQCGASARAHYCKRLSAALLTLLAHTEKSRASEETATCDARATPSTFHDGPRKVL